MFLKQFFSNGFTRGTLLLARLARGRLSELENFCLKLCEGSYKFKRELKPHEIRREERKKEKRKERKEERKKERCSSSEVTQSP